MPTHALTLRIDHRTVEALDEIIKNNRPIYTNRNHLLRMIINDFLYRRKTGPRAESRQFKTLSSNPIPDGFPLQSWLQKMADHANYAPSYSSWKSISQPDGYIYFHIDFFSDIIEMSVSEAGLSAGAFAGEGKTARECRLRAYYDLVRGYGGGHPWVGSSYYAGTFYIKNLRSGHSHKFRLVPVAAATLGANPEDLENQRMQNPVLQSIEISYGRQRF